MEERGLLRDLGGPAREVAERELAEIDAVESHPPASRVVEPGREVGDRGLPRAARSDERHHLAGRDLERQILDRPGRALARVAHAHVLERKSATRRSDALRVLGVGDLDRKVEVIEDASEHRARAQHVDVGVDQGCARHVEPAQIADKGNDRPDRDRAADRFVAADPVDESGADRSEQHDEREKPAPDRALAHLQVANRLRLLTEALALVRLGAEQPHEQVAAHRERFLDDVGDLGHLLLGGGRDLAPHLADAAGRQNEEGQHGDRHEREPPVDPEDHEQRARNHQDVGDQVDHRAGHHPLHAAHVVLEARDDFARLGVREEAQGLAEQTVEHVDADLVHHALPHEGCEVALPHPDQARQDRRADHAGDEQVEQPAVVTRNGAVDQIPDEKRRQEPEQCARDDADQDQRRGTPRRQQVTPDPPHVATAQPDVLRCLLEIEVKCAQGPSRPWGGYVAAAGPASRASSRGM